MSRREKHVFGSTLNNPRNLNLKLNLYIIIYNNFPPKYGSGIVNQSFFCEKCPNPTEVTTRYPFIMMTQLKI